MIDLNLVVEREVQKRFIPLINVVTTQLEMGYSSTEIMNITDVRGFEWSETVNDILEVTHGKIDLSNVDKGLYYGYNLEEDALITYEQYLGILIELLDKGY